MQQYADLELSLHKADAGMYSVQFRFSQPGREADTGLGQEKPVWVELNPADEAFAIDLWDAEAYGQALTEAVFKDLALQTVFGQARSSAESQNLPLRLRLWIGSSAPEQYAHIAAQIEQQDERTLEPLRARRYLEKYFIKGANINIFWGRAEDHLAGLMQNWDQC